MVIGPSSYNYADRRIRLPQGFADQGARPIPHFGSRARPAIGGEIAHQGRGEPDCGEYCEAAGAIAQALNYFSASRVTN